MLCNYWPINGCAAVSWPTTYHQVTNTVFNWLTIIFNVCVKVGRKTFEAGVFLSFVVVGISCVCMCLAESLCEALKAISVTTELIEEELKPHLDTLLAALLEKSKSFNAPAHKYTLSQRVNILCKHQTIRSPQYNIVVFRHWGIDQKYSDVLFCPWCSAELSPLYQIYSGLSSYLRSGHQTVNHLRPSWAWE